MNAHLSTVLPATASTGTIKRKRKKGRSHYQLVTHKMSHETKSQGAILLHWRLSYTCLCRQNDSLYTQASALFFLQTSGTSAEPMRGKKRQGNERLRRIAFRDNELDKRVEGTVFTSSKSATIREFIASNAQ